ncbi:hypothetical protein ERS044025_00736 [Streptococcus pneumoniae]|nr:hypothetical protein ERS044038_00875 [Streptococcus pneumoniae]CTD89634.1 hypothetical protein ERS044046_00804 [Streptococcus pneumoniae]CTD96486.1 hypothetical protein ERS044118_00561 [Streptococcus pneumoniae]CTD99424.1 hypothetical protein ERS044129_00626 [Streptococcus pneumoniae]CTE03137.1 hypothetical protein ERS044076_00829 [Streptococcus pneumoniae]
MKTMKKSAKVVLLASLLSIGLFQSSVSAKTVLKNYRYDWNTFYESKMNYHAYRYKVIPEWSRYYSYSEYKVGGGWNYARYEVINYYTGGY